MQTISVFKNLVQYHKNPFDTNEYEYFLSDVSISLFWGEGGF